MNLELVCVNFGANSNQFSDALFLLYKFRFKYVWRHHMPSVCKELDTGNQIEAEFLLAHDVIDSKY